MSTEDQDNTSFDDVFAEITAGEPEPADPEFDIPAEPEPEPVPAEPEPVPAEPEPVPAEPEPVPAEPVPAEPPTEPLPLGTPLDTAVSAEEAAELERLRRENEELRNRAPTEPPAEEPPAEPAVQKPVLTDEELNKINAYREDWPDVSEAEALLRKEMSENIKNEVYTAVGQVLQQFYQLVKPVLQDHTVASMSKRDATVTQAHTDWGQIKPSVYAWVEKQPNIISAAYKQTLDNGAADDVISVVSLYKQATGSGAQAPKVMPVTPNTPPSAPALEVVTSGKRTTQVVTEPDKNDFEGGWAEALRDAS